MKRVAPFVALILVLGRAASAFAADPRYPDWPCNQIKVPELSVAAIWTGPPIDDVGDTWERDPQIKDLVVRLAARRTLLDDAEKTIGDFLAASAGRTSRHGRSCCLPACLRRSTASGPWS